MSHGRHAKRYAKMFGLAAVAAMAVMAFAGAASASAAKPQFVLPAGESFPVPFTSEATSEVQILETVPTTEVVECRNEGTTKTTNAGEITNSKEDVVTVRFRNCRAFGFSCTGGEVLEGEPPLATGEIRVHAKSYLVYSFHGETKVVSDLLFPTSETFPPKQPSEAPAQIAEFTCGGITTVRVRGSVLGAFNQAQLNEFRNNATLAFSETNGVQESGTEYEREGGERRIAYLQSKKGIGSWKQAAERTTDLITLNGGRQVKIEG